MGLLPEDDKPPLGSGVEGVVMNADRLTDLLGRTDIPATLTSTRLSR